MTSLTIRPESTSDYNNVYSLIKQSFATAEHCDGNEQDLVAALRESNAFVPELSLVAEIDGKLAGHILFTEIKIGEVTALALAPLAVLPECQKKGVGSALIKAGHEKARELGYSCSVVLGSENYYPKFGYVPAEKYNIKAPFDVPSENFMVYWLSEIDNSVSGTVEYDKAFGI